MLMGDQWFIESMIAPLGTAEVFLHQVRPLPDGLQTSHLI